MKNYQVFLLLLFCFLTAGFLSASEYTISGQITIEQQPASPEGLEVRIVSQAHQVDEITHTDAAGHYELTLDLPDQEAIIFFVSTIDICTGDVLTTLVMVAAGGAAAADFSLCPDGSDPGDCGCPAVFDEVCVVIIPGILVPFPNACLAECAGFDPSQFVDCHSGDPDTTDCACPLVIEPVCVETDDGIVLTFLNACLAECEGYDPSQFVDCSDPGDCGCPEIYDPVCVILDSGVILSFDNACFAECAGYDPSQFVDCEDGSDPDDCGCPAVIDEVCVEIEPGLIIGFPNACVAECEGFDPSQFVDCDDDGSAPGDCNCPEIYDPVCIDLGMGLILPFPNACFAECAGFDPSQIEDCEDGFANNHVLTLKSNEKKAGMLHSLWVSPNPVINDLLQLTLKADQATTVELSILSIGGQRIKSARYELVAGRQALSMAVDDLAGGVYVVHLRTGETHEVRKFIKH